MTCCNPKLCGRESLVLVLLRWTLGLDDCFYMNAHNEGYHDIRTVG
jgi:hypothetical protein